MGIRIHGKEIKTRNGYQNIWNGNRTYQRVVRKRLISATTKGERNSGRAREEGERERGASERSASLQGAREGGREGGRMPHT